MSKKRLTKSQKAFVVERANGCCEYCLCQEDISPSGFSIEHIIPLAKGGITDVEYVAFSCQECNNHKYTHTHGTDIETGLEVPLFNPRLDHWSEHFHWSEDFLTIQGISSVGRITIEKLQLNRNRVMRLRRALVQTGEHPPNH